MSAYQHTSVLVDEVVQFLSPQSNQNYLDLTLGGGGHSKAILDNISIPFLHIAEATGMEIKSNNLKV